MNPFKKLINISLLIAGIVLFLPITGCQNPEGNTKVTSSSTSFLYKQQQIQTAFFELKSEESLQGKSVDYLMQYTDWFKSYEAGIRKTYIQSVINLYNKSDGE